MIRIQVTNMTRGTVLGGDVQLADELWSRTRGFLFRPEPGPGEGMLLSPCQGVHMFGLRFALDVVFIDEEGRVVGLYPDLRPWRWTSIHRLAMHALELPVGTIDRSATRLGDALSWTAVRSAGRDQLELEMIESESRRGPERIAI
ncbi:MAG: DUF192 domain-containing protein [Candidatus Longimicrobiales bacterium M2_2A_002]